jgi:hypothetical protein
MMEHFTAIKSAIILGLDVEADDPAMRDFLPPLTPDQIDWLASWLVSEGIGKRK